jgi:hypothetical protein
VLCFFLSLALTKLLVQAMSIKGVFFAMLGAAVVQVHFAFFKSSYSIFMFVGWLSAAP